jgi:CHAT domain-containing protein/tetratricopeptide (TPR) repeat protein
MRPPCRTFLISAVLVPALLAVTQPGFAAPSRAADATDLEASIDRHILTGELIEGFGDAVELLRGRLTTSGPGTPEAVDALRRNATALRELGDAELAEALWRLTHAASVETYGPSHLRVAEALTGIASTARHVLPVYEDMSPYFDKALSMLDPLMPQERILIAKTYRSQAFNFWRNDTDRSLALFESALRIFDEEPNGSPFEAAVTRIWLGWTMLHLGRHSEARIHLERGLRDLEGLNLSMRAGAGTAESALADLDALAGEWRRAEQGYLRAIERYERARRIGSTRFAEFPLHGFNLVALTQLKQGRPEEAWKSLQYYRAPVGKRLQSLADWKRRSPSTYAEVLKLRETVVERRGLRRRAAPPQNTSEVDWSAVVDELEANARLFRLEASYYAADAVRSVELAELQAVLPQDHAYIGWLDSRIGDELLTSPGSILDSRWMFIVRSTGPLVWIPMWESTTLQAQRALRIDASDYGETMERAATWTLRVEDDPRLRQLARILAEQEFNAALPYLEGIDHLVVEFFEDRVAWKPIEALVMPDGRYVGERFSVTYSPSADVFVAARRSSGVRVADGPVVAFGDPIFSPDGVRIPSTETDLYEAGRRSAFDRTRLRAATNGDPAALNSLPGLPYAHLEIENLRRLFPHCRAFTGAEATEENMRRVFQKPGGADFGIVHIATHALSETSLLQRCALALSRRGVDGSPLNDGLVDALEIQLAWHFRADLVTLNSCQTASGSGWFRSEPKGLSTIMLGVGAKSVVANLWKVDDLAVALLMSRFYENLGGVSGGGRVREPMSKAAALAEARNWLRNYVDDKGRKPFAHPIYWSGTVLMGDPG